MAHSIDRCMLLPYGVHNMNISKANEDLYFVATEECCLTYTPYPSNSFSNLPPSGYTFNPGEMVGPCKPLNIDDGINPKATPGACGKHERNHGIAHTITVTP